VIIVDETQQTRTIFFDSAAAARARVDWPPDDVIRSARVLFVDHFGVDGMLRAARVAQAAGIPVVADLENVPDHPLFADLVALVDHPVTSLDFAQRWTGCREPAAAARALSSAARRAVVVTCGADGCWYLDGETCEPRHFPAFRVPVVDTTGCGDVFHGAYAAGLAEGLDVARRIALASAAAALKATGRGGQAAIPTRAAVDQFLQEHGP